jgi:hypothetical protein
MEKMYERKAKKKEEECDGIAGDRATEVRILRYKDDNFSL